MARQIEGVYENVLECAKQEFLAKGFKDASLRVIAQRAATSTSSIYTRFGDKEGLFEAIVEPAAEGMVELFLDIQQRFHQMEDEAQRHAFTAGGEVGFNEILDFLYEHFEEFRLLLDCSNGTRFGKFIERMVGIEVEYTYKFMDVIGCESIKDGTVTEEFLHIIVTGYMNSMFEVVRGNMKKPDAERYVKMLHDYHKAGFTTIFGRSL